MDCHFCLPLELLTRHKEPGGKGPRPSLGKPGHRLSPGGAFCWEHSPHQRAHSQLLASQKQADNARCFQPLSAGGSLSAVVTNTVIYVLTPELTLAPARSPVTRAHTVTSLREILVVPREKTPTGAAARGNP